MQDNNNKIPIDNDVVIDKQNMNNQMQIDMGNMKPRNMFQRNDGFPNQGYPQYNGFIQNTRFNQNNQSPINMKRCSLG